MAKYAHAVTKRAPPGPPPFTLVGNSLQLERDYEGTVLQAAAKFPDEPLLLFWVGGSPFLVANDPAVVRRALASDRYDKPAYVGYRSKSVRMAVELQSQQKDVTLHELDNPDASRPVFQAIVKSRYADVLNRVENYVNQISVGHKTTDLTSELHPLFTRLNMDLLFNLHDEAKADRLSQLVLAAGGEFQRRLTNPYRALMNPLSNIPFIMNVGLLVREGRRLVHHLDTTSGSWVHAWVTREGMHPFRYLGKVIGLVIAATQTVPPSAAWALHFLSQPANQHVLAKLKAELASLPAELSFDDVMDRMPYTEAVVKEVLRLRPPFPLLQRAAQADDEIGGYAIPKGTVINVVPALMQRSPKYWKDPESFVPERFEGGRPNGDAASPFAYLPFGRGPRMCIGASLGLLEIKLFVATVVRKWNFVSESAESANGSNIHVQFTSPAASQADHASQPQTTQH
jgi:cytochrome P450